VPWSSSWDKFRAAISFLDIIKHFLPKHAAYDIFTKRQVGRETNQVPGRSPRTAARQQSPLDQRIHRPVHGDLAFHPDQGTQLLRTPGLYSSCQSVTQKLSIHQPNLRTLNRDAPKPHQIRHGHVKILEKRVVLLRRLTIYILFLHIL
jgi:hypothetical protein